MRIFISTGEVSGDLQGALLIEALYRQAQATGLELEIVALGGDRMAAAGATLLSNTSGIGSVGLFESLPYVLPTLQVQRRAKQYLRENPPDLVVLIDYLGPNIGVGTYLQRQMPQVPVAYYITPQVWVWSPFKRDTTRIIEISDQVLAIFPEEAQYFQKRGASAAWVGHPLVDRMQKAPSREAARRILEIESEQIAIALLPASRPQELKYLMPVMFEAAKTIQNKLPQVHFWIPLSLEAYRLQIEEAIGRYGLNATLVAGKSQEVLAAADLAIAKSGTVNLELALLNVPQVVLYRVSRFTYWIARNLLKFSISFMSPANLVLMRSIVPELLQEQATPENIVQEALELLLNPERRQQTVADYQEMRSSLGEVGVCDRAAKEIFQML
ncbi:lipid-A-disaccharide synthase [Coleofasciculus sp. FACHB-64]|uniref:lipid-A-disaccharide synthase n=1 Tax=Cyanophyceae TaxID=3028117 RepID=UPI00168A0C53|nr:MULTISPECIES: lipid-A-disaccharide synthase [unclassified Coleofasciculus]MBD1894095.1 lipid-A-disaccharide synthase [Coleofasciculus sp. FACHB-129]MBD2047378.1 lipid-A-disaccharide synthase [Coleofasciculus sp. FACHB-64]